VTQLSEDLDVAFDHPDLVALTLWRGQLHERFMFLTTSEVEALIQFYQEEVK
jgi:hypothetical protein